MMVFAAMALEEHCHGYTRSAVPLSPSDKALSETVAPDVDSVKSKEKLNMSHDFAPKVRKPYTITKQRERWTDDEHKKFIEALKLYGRAWRKIEEHVGTKTAVQIRSHAQKFFSKVVRESNAGDAGSVKPIEIPPPRPKRKPMHPYPRKLVSPVKTRITVPDKQTNPVSPKYSEQDNQSPTSVLSAIGSDSSVEPDSCMPIGSPSVSSALAFNAGTVCGSEAPKLVSEGATSSQPDHQDESPDEHAPLELEFTPQNSVFVKEEPNESATQCLKLFGKTLLLVDPQEPSHLTTETCKMDLFNTSEESCLLPCRAVPLKFPTSTSEYMWNDPFYPQTVSGKLSSPVDTHCPVPLPWLTLCSNSSHSSTEVHSPIPIKALPLCAMKGKLDNKKQKEGSPTDSNTTISSLISREHTGKEDTSFSSYKLTSGRSLNSRKGFMPYKRCLSEQEKTPEEREQQRIHLCL